MKMDFSPSANLDHSNKCGIMKGIQLRFRQVGVSWNVEKHPNQIRETALGPQVILAIRKATTWAALTGVANLDALQEVSETDRMYY